VLAVDHGDVAAHVLAGEQLGPHEAGPLRVLVLVRVAEDARVDAHALQVEDGLAEHRERRRVHAVRSARESLRLRDQELIVDPAVLRVELI
jgi:hypothetical protein